MKLYLAAAALPLVTGYMGGFNTYGRPNFMNPGCSPQQAREQLRQQKEWVDRAFSNLESDIDSAGRENKRRRSRNPKVTEERIRQQQDWINRAFGLASDVASGTASTPQDEKEIDEVLQQQQEWVNRAFGFVSDVSSGLSSPRYEVREKDDAFLVVMDVPGVKPSDIDVTVAEEKGRQVLTIKGQRNLLQDEASPADKFSKSFSLDSAIDSDKIAARLENGVLTVTAAKKLEKEEKKTKKIPITEESKESTSL